MTQLDDRRWMLRCVELARQAEGRTAPNPIVGSVVIGAGGELLAEGWHRGPGTPHGEADALARLGGLAPGATIYVSLEPCAHPSPRKPAPCADLVAASGAARLVYGTADPVPGHGGGNARVRAAGIEVVGPVEEEACRRANAPFLTWAERGRAHVTLKAAASLDGKIATRTGESRWITGPEARADGHRVRDRLDAILVGVGTVIADDPLLTVRGVDGGRDPIRLVLDPTLRMPPGAAMLRSGSAAPTWVITTAEAAAERAQALIDAGAEILRCGDRGAIDLARLLADLPGRGVLAVLVEGGAVTHGRFFAAGLVDRVLLYLAPIVIGGPAPGWVGGPGVAKLAEAHGFRFDGPPVPLGRDLLLELER